MTLAVVIIEALGAYALAIVMVIAIKAANDLIVSIIQAVCQ